MAQVDDELNGRVAGPKDLLNWLVALHFSGIKEWCLSDLHFTTSYDEEPKLHLAAAPWQFHP
jgi:hypothetical protein